jgi:uncharacterized membrane protein YhhN
MGKFNSFLWLFFTVSIAELLGVSLGWMEVHYVAKSLIMLSLIGYYMSRAAKRSGLFIRAMFFCWAGDVVLLMQNEAEIYFMLGLFAFAIGHLLYIYAYRQLQWDDVPPMNSRTKILTSLPVYLYGIGLLVVLYPGLGSLAVPVLIYALVLVVMVQTAIHRYGRTGPDSYGLVIVGASLFTISDSVLAINKFYSPFAGASGVIMLTYILGQYLIVEGVVRHRQ